MNASSTRTIHLTFSPYRRQDFFDQPNIASLLLTIFDLIGTLHHLQYHEIAVMPDHVHMLLSYAAERDIHQDIIRIIKGCSSRFFRQITKPQEPHLWRRGHYQVAIKSHEQLKEALAYIQQNPAKEHLDPAPRLLSFFRNT